MMLTVLLLISSASDPLVLGVSVSRHNEVTAALLHVFTTPDALSPAECDLSAFGGRSEEFIVVRGNSDESIPIVPMKPSVWGACATPETVDVARAAAKKKARGLGFDPDAAPLDAVPVDGKNMRIESTLTAKNDATYHLGVKLALDKYENVFFSPNNNAALAKSDDDPLAGDSVPLRAWLVKADGRTVILERVVYKRWHGEPPTFFRVSTPVTLPANGFDALVAAPPKLPAGCEVSIVAEHSMLKSYPVTLAYLFKTPKGPAPTSEMQAPRENNEVFALPKCTAVANDIASKLPGGATVGELDWKAPGGIVIALSRRPPR